MPKTQPAQRHSDAASRIRSANTGDYASILTLLEKVNLPTQGVKEHLDNFVILMDGEMLIGAGGLEIHGNKALLRSLAIHPDYQNRGWGKQIYRRLLENARLKNVTELYLLTETAETFFASAGFEKIPRELADEQVRTSEEFRSICPSTAVCMRLKLI